MGMVQLIMNSPVRSATVPEVLNAKHAKVAELTYEECMEIVKAAPAKKK